MDIEYSCLLLFAVVMFCKLTVNIELVNTKLLVLGEKQLGSCEPLVVTFLSTSQHVTLFYVCFCFNIIFYMCFCFNIINTFLI